MSDELTRKVMEQYGDAFRLHDPSLLEDILHPDCVLENTSPAPDGARMVGRDECLKFWSGIASNKDLNFDTEEMWVAGDRAVRRWTLHWGPGETDRVRGVNLMRLQDGLIIEGMGYNKS